eukprot:TRINITY_DN80367_c0_g1_i1.p1 TRINITY_DN80367_c0_g1~~TRINITY_DN80367_c0_g1_i1.p1  ORF type:complete len:392 (+),score=57.40 TRINITY_DN80367_c0_g1_i1:200-1375(+)
MSFVELTASILICLLSVAGWITLSYSESKGFSSWLLRLRAVLGLGSADVSCSAEETVISPRPFHQALKRPPRAYYPFASTRGVMGLRPLENDSGGVLFDVDAQYRAQVELKRTLFRLARGDVFAEVPKTSAIHAQMRAASQEALGFVVGRLQKECPGLLKVVARNSSDASVSGGRATSLVNVGTGHFWDLEEDWQAKGEHPLVVAAANVQEDLALLLPSHTEGGDLNDENTYMLAAAAVCFPDQWDVKEKIGKSLAGIHAPVEKYPRIESAMNTFFRSLKAGEEKIRYNFTFCERSSLHLPQEVEATDCPVPDTGLPHALHLRVERQGLVRLAKSGAVLFTIRTYMQAVEDIPQQLRGPLIAELRDSAGLKTPLGRHHKDKYGERVCAALA